MAGIVSEFTGTIQDVFNPGSDFGKLNPASDGGPLVLSERTGEKRTLALSGRALPYRGPEFVGTMRAEFMAYPGNPTRSVQVLGAEEGSTTFSGTWKDRFLGKGAEADASVYLGDKGVYSAMELALLVDDFRRKGQLIRMQWDAIARDGILIGFSFKPQNRHDLEWSMTFQWISQGEDAFPVSMVPPPSLDEVRGSWLDQLEGLLDDVQAPFAMVDGVATAIDQQVRRAEAAIDMITQTGTGILGTIQSAVQSLQHIVGLLDSLRGAGETLRLALDATPGASMAVSPLASVLDSSGTFARADGGAVGASVGQSSGASASTHAQQVRAERYRRRMMRRARTMRHLAARQLQAVLERLEPDLLAIFIAPAELDYWTISTTYYGTPDEWWRLQRFNNSSTSLVAVGTVIFVPRLDILRDRFDRRFEPAGVRP